MMRIFAIVLCLGLMLMGGCEKKTVIKSPIPTLEGREGDWLTDGIVGICASKFFEMIIPMSGVTLGMNYQIANISAQDLYFDKIDIETQTTGFKDSNEFAPVGIHTATIRSSEGYQIIFGYVDAPETPPNLQPFLLPSERVMELEANSNVGIFKDRSYKMIIALYLGGNKIHGPFTIYTTASLNERKNEFAFK